MHNRLLTLLLLCLLHSAAVFAEEGVSWDSLSMEEQTLLEDFKDKWGQLPAKRQQRMQKGARRWGKMSR